MPPPAVFNCSHVCFEPFFFFFRSHTFILYEESGEHFSLFSCQLLPGFKPPPSLAGYCRLHPAFFAVESPTGPFDCLHRVRKVDGVHTQSCQTLCGYEKVWQSPEERIRWGRFFSPPESRKPFISSLSPSPSLIARVNITDFYFSSFYFLLQSCLYLISLILSTKRS